MSDSQPGDTNTETIDFESPSIRSPRIAPRKARAHSQTFTIAYTHTHTHTDDRAYFFLSVTPSVSHTHSRRTLAVCESLLAGMTPLATSFLTGLQDI